jgi:pimeloyl-ACP methyl ester carboxylesterase
MPEGGEEMKTKILLAAIALSLLLVGCGQATPTPTAVVLAPSATPAPTDTVPPEPPTDTPAPSPTAEPTTEPTAETPAAFMSAPCPMQLPAGQVEGDSVECGYLVVPEDRADPDGGELKLAVAIFHPPGGATEPDPIIYLTGGPGGSGLEFLFLVFNIAFAPVLDTDRDLIVLDQRGIGYSEPALDCPGVFALGRDLLDMEVDGRQLTDDEATELFMEAVNACEADLSTVADLTAYNTAANAADINDLRLALGYDQVNLWSTSYGTRLALEVMRDYPEGLRSVVLDAVYPPDVDLYMELPANAERAFDTLFASCAADAACDAAFPDLETVFFDTVDRLNEEPATFEVTDALTRERYDTVLSGSDLVAILFSFLYHTEVIPSLPQIIYDASEGNFDLVALIQGSLMAQQGAVSLGMQLSVQCNEEFVFSSLDEYKALLAEYPDLAGFLENAMVGVPGFLVCEEWDSGQADPIENEPVTSEVPTLLMAGEFDPITPPAWAWRAAETLSKSTVFEFPGVGHGASVVEGCPFDTMIAFLDDPTTPPDDACTADMAVEFAVPSDEAVAVEMEPFANEAMGITGLAPAGWTEAGLGVYTRASSALDVATLIEQAAPGTADQLLTGLVGQLGLSEAPASTGEREANDLTWMLYELQVQTVSVDIALAESDGLVLIVLLQSAQDERDGLYEAVYLPAIDALVPVE